jgi:hypothetical protein
MLYKFTALILVVLMSGFIQAQNRTGKYHQLLPNVALTGDEASVIGNSEVVTSQPPFTSGPVNSGSLTWEMHNIYDLASGYDLQSNASTSQVWYDLNNPGVLHSVFMVSALASGWADRTSMYVGSTDNGVTWFELGGVPVNTGTSGRSGYCRISGTSDGKAVIMNHPEYDTPARPRSILYIDSGPFDYNFTAYEPGLLTGDPNPYVIWPRFTVDGNNNVIFGGAQSTNYGTADSMYTNYFDAGSSSFDGYVVHDGDQAEVYPIEISPAGKVAQAFIGGVDAVTGDVWYRESLDGGQTWEAPTMIYTREPGDTTMGAIRGIALNFYGEEPCVVFETALQVWPSNYFQDGPAQLVFWSPNINGGQPKVLLDDSWVNFNPGGGPNDVMLGISRPVLARTQIGGYLLLSFNAASSNLDPYNANAPYFDGWFMYSSDGGDTWSDPEKFTPDGPPLTDWRYASMPQVLPVEQGVDNIATVHIVMEGDTLAGSQVQGTPKAVSAYFFHFSTEINLGPNAVGDPSVVNEFNLGQNYPNPFNPSTTINYSLAERSVVALRVYDVLGNEVASLVNTTQEAGTHSVKFDASKLASGLYVYTLNAGDFTSSKKMMLLK